MGLMTYNQLFNRVYGPEPVDAEFWAEVGQPTRAAWAVMLTLHARKGFDWWFDDLPTKLKNEIFSDKLPRGVLSQQRWPAFALIRLRGTVPRRAWEPRFVRLTYPLAQGRGCRARLTAH